MRQSDRVYEALKDEIVAHRLQPGEQLPESTLVEQFKASRTPVREALQRLAADGLVRLVPGLGAFVAEISVNMIVELFELREGLEALAARLAARTDTRAAVSPVIEELRGFSDGVPAERVTAYLELAHRLDATILQLAANSRLAAHLESVWQQAEWVRNAARSRPDRLDATVAEHLDIATAIADGDEDAAAAAVGRHVRRSLQGFLGSLGASPDMAAAGMSS